jgi:hypothetical protein
MFVSSVDVEQGNKNGNKRKQKQEVNYAYGEEGEHMGGDAWMDPESFYADADVDMTPCNYDTKIPAPTDTPSYETAERAWSTYVKITTPEELSEEGRVVGWWVSIISPHYLTAALILIIF